MAGFTDQLASACNGTLKARLMKLSSLILPGVAVGAVPQDLKRMHITIAVISYALIVVRKYPNQKRRLCFVHLVL